MNNTPSLNINIGISMLYQILTVAVPFITTPYISRVLGVENIGIYSYTASIQAYFSLFAALGTYSYGRREIARNRDSMENRSRLFWEIELISVVTSIFCLFAWSILILNSVQYKVLYAILTLSLLNTCFDISWFFAGLEQFKITVIRNSLVKLAGIFLLFAFIKTKDDLILYMLFIGATNFLGTISMWFALPKFVQKVSIKNIHIFTHFKETLVFFIPTISISVYTLLDKVLIGVITKDYAENGFYEQATKVINLIKLTAISSINAVIESRVSYLVKENKYDEIKTRIEKSLDCIFVLTFVSVFGLISVCKDFVSLFFGAGYDKVSNLLILLSPVVIIITISDSLSCLYYKPFGMLKQNNLFIILGAISNLVLNLLLIPKFKSIGAIIGTLFAESFIAILYLSFCNSYITIKKIVFLAWKKLLAAIIMAISIFFIKQAMCNFEKIYSLLIQIATGISIYILILILLKDSFVYSSLQLLKRKKEASF